VILCVKGLTLDPYFFKEVLMNGARETERPV
jgi:hypothetical protein